jgi:preprotein translocase subunit SecG
MSIILSLLIALHVLVCAFMILVVLMQRPRSEGLGSAFGGGITDNVFGSQTTNVLAKFTTWMGIAFFAITLLLSILTAKANSGKTAVQKKLLSEPVPAAVSTPTPAAPSTPEATPTASATPVTEPAQETPKATPEVETAPLEAAPEASPEATTPAQN